MIASSKAITGNMQLSEKNRGECNGEENKRESGECKAWQQKSPTYQETKDHSQLTAKKKDRGDITQMPGEETKIGNAALKLSNIATLPDEGKEKDKANRTAAKCREKSDNIRQTHNTHLTFSLLFLTLFLGEMVLLTTGF
ncbi:hypothetical protein KSF_112300 [Reticulibacter mediterranei]|uniref:Uncharacterized protein n=1 Tax=Reticulibacter mediterranei TaxID=2778369 RepID=A0A8J3N783_9CHLR|nr:hypothetical protein KSF_112300 [Reticulibacter mediterranei]